MSDQSSIAAFSGLVDLASERIGGRAMAASDEFFAEKENLLKPGRGVFVEGKFTDRGKWMDGWESRRKRTPGNDWCVIKLGIPGIIEGIDIDTNHFLGNHPPFASVEACVGEPIGESSWSELVPLSALRPGSQNLFAVHSRERWTHVRLNIVPDGGVARFRAYGVPARDWSVLDSERPVDLASVASGGRALVCSDMFFSDMQNLLLPGPSENMGDGWESRRRRGPGSDWVVIRLGTPGYVSRIVVDTSHFKGNYPECCSVDCINAPDATLRDFLFDAVSWRPLLPESVLRPDARHEFESEVQSSGICTHVRLNIYPDGGIARLRVFGVTSAGR